MAKSKAELEIDACQHTALMNETRMLHASGKILPSVRMAVSAWPHVDGMLQYERRFGDRQATRAIDSIDFVLSYAPVTFDAEALTELEGLLKSQRRIVKSASTDLVQRLVDAKTLMWSAYSVWTHLERYEGFDLQELESVLGHDIRWHGVVQTWQHLGMVVCIDAGGRQIVRLATQLNGSLLACCGQCGVRRPMLLTEYLAPIDCQACGCSTFFVRADSST